MTPGYQFQRRVRSRLNWVLTLIVALLSAAAIVALERFFL